MNANPGRGTPLDRGLSLLARVALGLAVFPVVTLLVAAVVAEALVALGISQSHVEGEIAFMAVFSILTGLAVSVLLVRKSGRVFRRALDLARAKLPEPVRSCVRFGILGALLSGGIMVAGILLLGHTRPIGWDFNHVLPSMALGFAVFVIGGLPVGLWRKRRRSSSAH
jgi:hypothetical protein